MTTRHWLCRLGALAAVWAVRAAAASTFSGNTWPGGVVPYEFNTQGDTAFSPEDQEFFITNVMTAWASCASIQFRPRQTLDLTWAHIQKAPAIDPGSHSDNGPGIGPRVLQLANPQSLSGGIHELGHLLCLHHEHQRPDRNQFIHIEADHLECAAPGQQDICDSDFVLLSFARVYGPYDFGSAMHYEQCAHSICGRDVCRNVPGDPTPPCITTTALVDCVTITVLPPNDMAWQNQIGCHARPSDFDCLTMSFLYPQPDWNFVDPTNTGSAENGTFLEPDRTFGGTDRGINRVPTGGTLWLLQQGNYEAVGVWNRAVTVLAPLGGAVLR